MPSLKSNFLYSSILTTAGYVFPLLTYPYVTRILGVNNIGLCNFIDSVISYFILASMMGMSVVGVREIANARNNREERNIVFSSLFSLNAITTILSLIILVIVCSTVKKCADHPELMVIGGTKIFFNFLLIEWLFKGLEDFKYITTRTIIVRSAFVILVFIFINEAGDYKLYYALICGMTVLNAVINCLYARKFVRFSFRRIRVSQYLKALFILGINSFLISMYTTFNVMYLGFISSNAEVGYYTTATKLYAIIIALYSAFTGVLLPRMSSLATENNISKFKELLNKSSLLLISCSVPVIFFAEIYAPQIIYLIAGSGFNGSILPFRIVIPLIFVIGYEQILVIQTLVPLKKESTIFRNSIVGAFVGLILNILLVPIFFACGSATVWVLSELTILILSQIAVKQAIGFQFPVKRIFYAIISYVPLCLILIISKIIFPGIFEMIIMAVITAIYFVVLHRFIKHDELGQYIKKFI